MTGLGEGGELVVENSKGVSQILVSADHKLQSFFTVKGQSYVMLDIGNTRIKSSLFSNDDLNIKDYFAGDIEGTVDKLGDWNQKHDLKFACVLSVQKETEKLLIQKTEGFGFSFFSLPRHFPFLSSNYNLETIGIDRLAAMVASGYLTDRQTPKIIVSAGTALTVDLIGENFHHMGGYICAGLGLRLKSLASCSLLPSVELLRDTKVGPATMTQDSMALGAVHETVAWIQQLSSNLAGSNEGTEVQLVLTGGESFALKPYFSNAICEEKLISIGGNLMLRGGYLEAFA